MASQVFKTEDITLQDGTDVTLKPLAIARLRRFMKAWEKFGDVENDDQGFASVLRKGNLLSVAAG